MARKELPVPFLKSLYHAVHDAYETASEKIREMSIARPEQANLLPWLRRTLVETALRRSGLRAGAIAKVETERASSWNHVVVTFGSLMLTQSTHNDLDKPLRFAQYKKTYAEKSQRVFDFRDDDGENVIPPKLYAVLLHHAPMNASTPDYVVIQFPTSDLSSFHPGQINLDADFLNETRPERIAIEVVSAEAMPILRKEVRNEAEQ